MSGMPHVFIQDERPYRERHSRWKCTCGKRGQFHDRDHDHSKLLWKQHVARETK